MISELKFPFYAKAFLIFIGLFAFIYMLDLGQHIIVPIIYFTISLTAIIKLVFDRIENLKPWGYLLGDTMPSIIDLKLPLKKIFQMKKV